MINNMASTRDLQTINSSGEITEIKLAGTTAGDKVLTSDEIDAKIPSLTNYLTYSGASENLDMGAFDVIAADVTAEDILTLGIDIGGMLTDGEDSTGTSGQLLSRSATGVKWINSYAGETVLSVSSLTESQLTVAKGTTTPELSIETAAVTNGSSSLATGDQIYDFVSASFLPYTGATDDLTLGSYDITANNLSGTNTGDQDMDGMLVDNGTTPMHSLSTTPEITGTVYTVSGWSQAGDSYALAIYGLDIASEFTTGTFMIFKDSSDTILGYRVSAGSVWIDSGSQTQIMYYGLTTDTPTDVAKVATVDGFNYTPIIDYDLSTKKYVDDNYVPINSTLISGALTNPPTSAELISLVGACATLGSGYEVNVWDSSNSIMYNINTDGTDWFYVAKTKAV